MYRSILILVIGPVVFAIGCGGPKYVKVTGHVTLNGESVNDGEIILVPDDRKLGADAGKITNGNFELLAKPGAKKVEIRASREIKSMKDNAMGGSTPQFESIIPPQYNDQSELKWTVSDSGEKDKLFELKGERGKTYVPRGP